MANQTDPNTDPKADGIEDAYPEIPEVDSESLPTEDDQDAAVRFESIRQLALRGELEFSPEADEIVGALLDTINQRDEHHAKLIRSVADLQNYQRRASNNEREAREMATRGVVSGLIPLIDQFELALTQNAESVSGEQVLTGVKMIRDEFLRTMAGYGVAPIQPEVGDEFNPGDHEAMLQQAAEGVEPGCISLVIGTGYKLGERVVRPAKVAVAPAAVEGEG